MPRAPVTLVLSLLLSGRSALAVWPQFGRAVSTAPGDQGAPALASDGAGGAIVAWVDFRSRTVNIFAHHLLPSGELDPAWPADGRALLTDPLALENAFEGQAFPAIVPDGSGGAIVAWQDGRSAVTGTDIVAQHILASGAVDPGWPSNGTLLCAIAGAQDIPVIVADGAGGAIVAWMDTRPGASVVDVYAQHVLASGLVDSRWPAGGLAVSTAPGPQEFPVIVSDASGGAILAWYDLRGIDFDVYAQHVLDRGVVDPAWPAGDRAIAVVGGHQQNVTVASDGAHGAIIAWDDTRAGGIPHVFAQHVLGSGAVDSAWPANGRAISAAVREELPKIVADGAGGAVVTWQDARSGSIDMYAQHVRSTGVVDAAWPVNGRALSVTPTNQSRAAIVPDGAGGAIVSWLDGANVFAQHVGASGALDPAYPVGGRAICDLPSVQSEPTLVATAPGGAIVVWSDLRNGAQADLFALEVLAAGSTDACPDGVPPQDVGNGVRVSRSGTDAVVSWPLAAGATRSDVLRGGVRDLPIGGTAGEQCLIDGTSGDTLSDVEVPATGDSYWYLVRGENGCGSGPYGFTGLHGTPGVARVSTTCP